MKKTFRGLTLAAAILSASTAANADESAQGYDGNGPVTPVAYIGDMPSHSEDAYFAESAEEAAKAQDAISQASHTSGPARQQIRQQPVNQHPVASRPPAATRRQIIPASGPMVRPGVPYSPVPVQHMAAPVQQMPPAYGSGSYHGGCPSGACGPVCGCDTGCDSYCDAPCCDSGCDSGCSSGGGCAIGGLSQMSSLFGGGACADMWWRSEALLWFIETRETPPLVTGTLPGELPILGLGATQTLFGNEVGGDMTVGYRSDIGKYFSDNIGLGARFWILNESKDDFYFAGDGSTGSVGRPFYDDFFNINNALLVAVDPGPADIEGAVAAVTKTNIRAAEAYARLNFTCSKTCQLDFLGGYTYFQVDDVTRIASASLSATSERLFGDVFDAENKFNGGHIGFESIIRRGKFVARSLTKVHLGNNRQRMRIFGGSVEDFLDPAVDPNIAASGLYTMGNQGDYERDIFTFVPEINLKLAYKVRKGLEVSVGYSMLYFDRVALSGINIDPTVDQSFLNTDGPFPARPAFTFEDDSLWVQGVDLGVALSY